MDERIIARFLDENRAEFLQDIMKLVSIPSVSIPDNRISDNGVPSAGQSSVSCRYPFGEGCARVLDAALSIGERMGFKTENHEYYCGSILMPGSEKGEIGMFSHLDVVPEGVGWINPPYIPYVSDGWLYGRGSSDNKGPAVTALYAMRCLQENGVRLRHTVRLFLGCSEENGMHDIAYYLDHFPAPDFSFTPDASFSVCYSEKGIMEADFTTPLPEEIIEFSAGTASNAVAGNAVALLKNMTGKIPEADPVLWPGITIKQDGSLLRVEAEGKSAHAAFPEGSENAAVMLAAFLCNCGLVSGKTCKILSFVSRCFKDYYGKALDISYEDEQLGRLTVIAGMTRTEKGMLRQNINIRYPAEADAERMERMLSAAAKAYGWKLSSVRNDPPSYVSPDSPLVQALDKACRDRLGPSFAPYTMGGGTYARRLPNAVAFGPGIRGQKKPGPDGHGGGHQPDECVRLQGLEDALYIYVQALLAVDQML